MFTDYSDNLQARSQKLMTMKNFYHLEKTLLFIARKSCPKDTRNMAENAIYSVKIKNGFMIVWDSKFAYYLPYVNEGINPLFPKSRKVIANKGFVDRSIAFIFGYLFNYLGIKEHSEKFGIYNEGFKKISRLKSTQKTHLAPLFVKQGHDILNGELPAIMDKESKKMMTNLMKSVKKYMAKASEYPNIIDTDIEYDFVNNEAYEIDNEGYFLRDKT